MESSEQTIKCILFACTILWNGMDRETNASGRRRRRRRRRKVSTKSCWITRINKKRGAQTLPCTPEMVRVLLFPRCFSSSSSFSFIMPLLLRQFFLSVFRMYGTVNVFVCSCAPVNKRDTDTLLHSSKWATKNENEIGMLWRDGTAVWQKYLTQAKTARSRCQRRRPKLLLPS